MSYPLYSFFLFVLYLYMNYAQSLHLNCLRTYSCALSSSFVFKKGEGEKGYSPQVPINCIRILLRNHGPDQVKFGKEKTDQKNHNQGTECRNLANNGTTPNHVTAPAITKGPPIATVAKCRRKGAGHLYKRTSRNKPDRKCDRHLCFAKTIYKDIVRDKQSIRYKSASLRKGTTLTTYASRSSGVREEKQKKNENLDKVEENDEYELINEYVLLKKNGKTIKELIDEGKWLCPKENIKIIRERTKQKINWNYILKKNNELLKDNVSKIYKEIVNKETVNDIFFTFETYPYNYLNIPMTIFSLYKIASTYFVEMKNKEPSVQKQQKNFFKSTNWENIKNDNFFSQNYTDEETDVNLWKLKEERRRLNEILKNKNFQRIIGSLNKHLKIIYKIFSTNEKLTSYEKNKKIYQYIPYINIKDIIMILKCFCILKFDHVNIYKYIYFFIIFFIEKFDIYFLTEAVYLCLLKKIYIKPLFQNYTKYLLNNLDKWDDSSTDEKIAQVETVDKKGAEQFKMGGKNETSNSAISTITTIDPTQPILSLYESINVREYYIYIEQILEGKNEHKKIATVPLFSSTTPLYLTNFDYSLYESANYSNLNYSQDELNKMENDSKEKMKKFTTQNYLKDKKEFLENKSEEVVIGTKRKHNDIKKHIDIKHGEKRINIYVYILHIMSKFPYTNSFILNRLCSKILSRINFITLEEMVLTFYSLAVLEYDVPKLQNCLYILILKNIHLLNFYNKDILLKLIKALYLTNNLISTQEEQDVQWSHKKEETKENNDWVQSKVESNNREEQYKKEQHKKKQEDNEGGDKTNIKNYIPNDNVPNDNVPNDNVPNDNVQNVKQLMLYIIAKMVLKKKMDFMPVELVDIIRYMASMNFINNELFHFVFSLPFFQSINEQVLNEYKNNLYLNNSYYAYTNNNTINTPIEIMLCKLYQAYLGYQAYMNQKNQMDQRNQMNQMDLMKQRNQMNEKHTMGRNSDNSTNTFDMTQIITEQNKEKSKIASLSKETIELLKKTYLNNMEISSYSSSSLHYEIADIILKDFKIPCHVEYKTEKGIVIDIAILYDDLKKVKKIDFFKNIAIEINGPFHYKTKALTDNLPQLNTKTIFKRRLLNSDNWQVISFPFWEIKPWFTKARKEKYILKMLPENIKNAFT